MEFINYAPSKKNRNLRPINFKNIAEKLAHNYDELRDTTISWEKFTGMFNLPMPKTMENRLKWVAYRTQWVIKINDAFTEMELPYTLRVVFDCGVELLEGKSAVARQINWDAKKIIKAQVNAINRANDMTKRVPEHKDAINSFASEINDTVLKFFGRIASNEETDGMFDLKALRKLLSNFK